MLPGALRALEFERIVEAVRSFALTPLGDESLGRLAPSTDPHKVGQLQAATSETARYLAHNALFPLRASSDLPQLLAALAVEGRALEPLRLLALATFLDSIDESRLSIRRASGTFPLLDLASGSVASFWTSSPSTSPQCPCEVYSQRQTSVITRSSRHSARIARTASATTASAA